MDALWQDLRYAIRTLRRNSSFTTVAVIVFAVGIGSNTAIFSIINAVLFRPPVVRAPHELVYINLYSRYPHGTQWDGLSYRDYQHLRDTTGVFEGVLTYGSDLARVGTGKDRQSVRGERVSANYFSVLGVQPILGRAFEPADNDRAASPVIIISRDFWQSALHGEPDVLGKQMALDNTYNSGRGRSYTIIGVVGPDFRGVANTWEATEYWVPMLPRSLDRELWCEPRFIGARGAVLGRLKSGVTFDTAHRAVVGKRSELEDPPDTKDWSLAVRSAKPSNDLPFAGTGRLVPERLAIALIMVTTILLLIAVANLTGVLMARGVARRHELAIRLTLGAGRWRIVRQLLVEGLLLASTGGLVGVWLSRSLTEVFVATIPASAGRFSPGTLLDVPLDARVVLFTAFLCIVTGCLISIGPARLASRIAVLGATAGSAIASPRPTRVVLRYVIVVPQVCLALVLLVASGLLIKTLLKVELIAPGYQPSGLVFLEVRVPGPTLCESEKRAAALRGEETTVQRRLLDAARALPATTGVAFAGSLPFANGMAQPVITREAFFEGAQSRWIARQDVTPGYFGTLGIPVRRGRDFDARDTREGAGVVVVNEALARMLWGDGNPVGDSIALYDRDDKSPPAWTTVVGVVGDVHEAIGVIGNLTAISDGTPKPTVYVPTERRGTILLARGRQAPARLLQDLAAAISSVDGNAEIYRSQTVTQAVGDILYPRRIAVALLGASGVIGLLLACMGLYGVVSFSVTQRVREIGIRAALGARQSDILRLIMRDGVSVVLIGSSLGLGLAAAALRITSATVVAMPSFDVFTFVGIPLSLAAVVLLACYVPARRAARVDPMVALREL